MPVIAPVFTSKLNPVGKLPEVTENVLAPVPFDADTVWLYATPWVKFGRLAGDIVTAGLITTV